jgi:hypothetical protein
VQRAWLLRRTRITTTTPRPPVEPAIIAWSPPSRVFVGHAWIAASDVTRAHLRAYCRQVPRKRHLIRTTCVFRRDR